MYRLEQAEPTEEFKRAWSAAGQYIQRQANSGFNWLRTSLNLPMAEHLSFRIGNQIFFVFVEAAEFTYKCDGRIFDKVCKEANAIPCLMPMSKSLGEWEPNNVGWALINANSNKAINPLDFVTDELIEMTDWELHDFAIQVVCSGLVKDGKNIFSKQPSCEINPSIWFEDEYGPHYVVVRAARYPETEVSVPNNIDDIKLECSEMSKSGYFAPVILVNSGDPFDSNAKSNGNFLPLYRGVGIFPNYPGILAL
jgi:hypothetical protein